ncbi:MAG: OmpA family protein, partial [Catalinimonas sp.]
ELNRAIDFLKKNESMTAEIAGHTDNIGSDAYNQGLSQQRARAVYDYFVQNGVPAGRLSSKGYGESEPAATNSTPEGRQQNRRVEMKLSR